MRRGKGRSIVIMLVVLLSVPLIAHSTYAAAPATPTIIKPLGKATTTLPIIDWTPVSGIEYYYCAIYKVNPWTLVAQAWPKVNEWYLGDKSLTVWQNGYSQLKDNETYELFVWAYNGQQFSASPATDIFTVYTVPYIPQTDFAGDTWYHLTHCCVATHCMAYRWLYKTGQASYWPTIDDYNKATGTAWDGGDWFTVDVGQMSSGAVSPGLAPIVHRVMCYKIWHVPYSDENANTGISDLKQCLNHGIPVEVAFSILYYGVWWGPDHSMLAVDYSMLNNTVEIWNPDNIYGNAHSWFSVDDIKAGWQHVGMVEVYKPTGDCGCQCVVNANPVSFYYTGSSSVYYAGSSYYTYGYLTIFISSDSSSIEDLTIKVYADSTQIWSTTITNYGDSYWSTVVNIPSTYMTSGHTYKVVVTNGDTSTNISIERIQLTATPEIIWSWM